VRGSEVASRANNLLNVFKIDNLSDNVVNQVTKLSVEASGNVSNSHLWATNRQEVSHGSFHFTLLYDVTSDETSLTQTNNVEFTIEISVFNNSIAS
jgi:hypothetical protein